MRFLNFTLIIVFLICSAESCFEKKEPIKPLPAKAAFDFKIGKNGEVQFTNISTNATRFYWNFGNGETSSEKSPKYTYKENGSYAVKLRVQSTESIDSLEKIIEIKDIPVETYVFICEDQGTCSLLNAASGKTIWDYKLYPYIISSPTFDKGQLFVATTGDRGDLAEIGKIISLDFEKGTKNWEFKVNTIIISSPIVVNDKIYFTSSSWNEGGTLHCLNTKDGKVVWELSSEQITDSSPTVYDGRIFMTTKTGLQIVDAENGNIIKNARKQNEALANIRRKSPQGFSLESSSPAIDNGICYYSFPKMLYSYNLKNQKINMFNLNSANYWSCSSPTIDNGILYVHEYSKLLAIDLSNFTEKWNFGGDNKQINGFDSPFIADKTVYSGGNGNLYAIDAQSGKEKWHSVINANQSAINYYQSILYINAVEKLLALDTNTGKEKWSLPLNSIGMGRSSTPLIITNKGEVFHGTISGARN